MDIKVIDGDKHGKILKFDRSQDLQLRVDNSIIKYKGEPVHAMATEATGPLRIALTPLKDIRTSYITSYFEDRYLPGVSFETHSSNPDIDYTTPADLGYFNTPLGDIPGVNPYHKKNAVWKVGRIMRRRYRHGLNEDNIIFLCKGPDEYNGVAPNQLGVHRQNLLFCEGFEKMLRHEFPNIIEARDLSYDQGVPVAFDPLWYAKTDEFGILKLYWMEKPVGYLEPKHDSLVLAPLYQTNRLVKEMIKQKLGGLAVDI